jgi:F-type H+-transporting ATPase subunit delta
LRRLAESVERAPEAIRLAEHPGIAPEEKLRVLLAPLDQPPPVLARFLTLLLERRYLRELPRLVRLLEQIRYEREGLLPVRVECAAPLTAEQTARLEAALERLLRHRAKVTAQVVPDLLGGLRLQVDSEVLDQSLAGRLERIAEYLSRA